MLRPSHPLSARLSSDLFPRRLAASGAVLAVQLAVAWAVVSGLAVQITNGFHPFEVVPVAERIRPAAPPPAPPIRQVVAPQVTMPDLIFDPNPGHEAITPGQPQSTPPVKPLSRLPVAADHGAIAIPATQTTPPYPAVAQRLGAEGKVILRLSVLADGTVAKAEIVTSSGRHDLDETAQQWVVAHWAYKPALKDGAPAPAQVLAAVRFTLKDAP